MTPDQIGRIVNDARLSPEAARLVLHVGLRGEGEQEIEPVELRILLRVNSDTPVYRARDIAVKHGYLKWRKGGPGHSTRYEFAEPTVYSREDCSPQQSTLGKTVDPQKVVDREIALSPIVPLPVLTPEADARIEEYGTLLVGCRGSIRDYLREVVPHNRQRAWVDDICGKLNGNGFSWQGIPRVEWAGMVAAAVNELRASGEKEMKWPAGDPRNMRTKLNILIQDRTRPARGSMVSGGPARASPRDRPADTQEYKPTDKWRGFNG